MPDPLLYVGFTRVGYSIPFVLVASVRMGNRLLQPFNSHVFKTRRQVQNRPRWHRATVVATKWSGSTNASIMPIPSVTCGSNRSNAKFCRNFETHAMSAGRGVSEFAQTAL